MSPSVIRRLNVPRGRWSVAVTTPVLQARFLSRTFGGLEALSDVSFSVPQGGVLAVIGPNGAGKSTLLDVLSGHRVPTGGRVLLDGVDVSGLAPAELARRGVGRTFQRPRLFQGMTVVEQVALGPMHARHLRPGRAEAEAMLLLERVGLADRATDRPRALEPHQVAALELAMALGTGSRILLLDELLAGLDREDVDSLVELVAALAREGRAVVVVDHVIAAVQRLADRVLVLVKGTVLLEGPEAEVLGDRRVVEAYLGQRYHHLRPFDARTPIVGDRVPPC